ncbi:MAG TPA: DNA repair protein RadC [Flavobacteriales bacterium]|jgi:DNA repair protein RadC|nr:DNA repair protein RadC [Flavobacteriales bacterium]
MENATRKPTIAEWAEDDRPREKLLRKGAAVLSDAELIAILLRSGSTTHNALDLARAVLQGVDNDLHRLGRLGVADLRRMGVSGLGQTKAITIVAALELGRRRKDLDPRDRHTVATSASAHELVRDVLQDLPYEEFWLLLLDRGNRLIERCKVSQGGMHGTVADPKVIFKEALDRRASSVVLCHNHPSGQLRPSEEDIRLTRKLVEGGRLLDIAVHDHLIVTTTGYYSFADNGML